VIAALTLWNAVGIVLAALILASVASVALWSVATIGRAYDRCPYCDSPPNPERNHHAAGCPWRTRP
jgi:hypothetical protein